MLADDRLCFFREGWSSEEDSSTCHEKYQSKGDNGDKRRVQAGVAGIVSWACNTLLDLESKRGRADGTHGTFFVVTLGTSSFRRVPTETRPGERAVVEWDGGEVGAGGIGPPVVGFDDGCLESDLIAVALLDRALGALAVGRNEVGGAANAVRAVITSIERSKVLAKTTSFGAYDQ